MIKIVTEKILDRGVRSRRILSIDGVRHRWELPHKYLNGYPYAEAIDREFATGVRKEIDIKHKGEYGVETLIIYEGRVMEEEEFQRAITLLRASAQRLQEIEKEIQEESRVWNGVETYCV